MVPTWLPDGPWRPLGGLLGPLGGLLELLKRLGRPRGGFQGLMGRSWTALGALLEASGAEKKTLERLLGAPRKFPRQVSAILGAKRLPKGSPRGSKIEPFLVSFSGSILGAFWVPQNDEKSYWRLGGKRIFTKSPVSF